MQRSWSHAQKTKVASRLSHGFASPSAPRSFCLSSPGVASRKEDLSMAAVRSSTLLAAASAVTASWALTVMEGLAVSGWVELECRTR